MPENSYCVYERLNRLYGSLKSLIIDVLLLIDDEGYAVTSSEHKDEIGFFGLRFFHLIKYSICMTEVDLTRMKTVYTAIKFISIKRGKPSQSRTQGVGQTA